MLTVEPPSRLEYTWKGGPLDTRVSITLEAVAAGTRLSLDHTGFHGPKALLVSLIMGRGWRGIVATGLRGVLDRFESGQTPATGAVHAGGAER